VSTYRLLKGIYRPVFRRAARQIMEGRLLDPEEPQRGRWLRRDVDAYLAAVQDRVDELLPAARLHELPTRGNRHNVFLAVVTTAAYRALIERGTSRQSAMILVADVGWKVYSWMLVAASLLFRLMSRDPTKRMERTLKALMMFPFSAPGRPGYEVKAWSEDHKFFTHWSHCPPQAFVRQIVTDQQDRGELEAFYRSWCLYDWPAADLLASDGERNHYERPHTMSKGGQICDMCWSGRALLRPG
jgi:hypothetical protein